MSMFKKCKVVMLPTNQKVINTKEYQLLLSNSLFWTSKIEIERYTEDWFFLKNSSSYNSSAITIPNVENFKHQHLYIISDDEIKEGDWCLFNELEVVKCTYSKNGEFLFSGPLTSSSNHHFSYFKKIITTTNTSLQWLDESERNPELARPNGLWKCLPQPSQQFIEKYIEEYNKGNVITDVLIEYELISNEEYFGNTVNPDNDVPYFDEKLKINPKDNTITIKKVKDSWNREEVIEFGNKVKEYCKDGWKPDSLHRVFFEWDKWVEENL